jgi:hypothetical protein
LVEAHNLLREMLGVIPKDPTHLICFVFVKKKEKKKKSTHKLNGIGCLKQETKHFSFIIGETGYN